MNSRPMRLFILLATVAVLLGTTSCGPSATDDAVKAARPLWQELQQSTADRRALEALLKTQAQTRDDEVRRLETLLREENTSAFCDGVEVIDNALDTGGSIGGNWITFASGLLTPALEDDFSEEQIAEMAEGIGAALQRLETAGRSAVNYSSALCVFA